MYRLLSGVFMGWSLGSNDSANVFGTAVASKMVKYRTAIILCAVFVVIGSLLGGARGLKTLSGIVDQTLTTAFIASLAAALTVTLMTVLQLPVSTSQAVIGAITGIGILLGDLNFYLLSKVFLVWVGTPVSTIVVAIALYFVLGKLLAAAPINIFAQDNILRIALIAAGCYAAYSLGANNVANVTGVYARVGLLNTPVALLVGGASIALGVLTFSRRVMRTVGKNLVRLDPFSAFIVVLSHAIMLDIFARIGVPTSSSQAIVGGVLGIGILKGMQTINARVLLLIVFGWLGTPLIALILSLILYSIFHLWSPAV